MDRTFIRLNGFSRVVASFVFDSRRMYSFSVALISVFTAFYMFLVTFFFLLVFYYCLMFFFYFYLPLSLLDD